VEVVVGWVFVIIVRLQGGGVTARRQNRIFPSSPLGHQKPRRAGTPGSRRVLASAFVSQLIHQGLHIWEFAPKRYPEISSLILRYPKISLNSNKSKDKFYGYERISLTG
jgi:hypothetical protein